MRSQQFDPSSLSDDLLPCLRTKRPSSEVFLEAQARRVIRAVRMPIAGGKTVTPTEMIDVLVNFGGLWCADGGRTR